MTSLSKSASLKPESLPLTGCHLIEASAGTGKTFNITRIYLRLLLERKLDVKNILVMTFTRAATEELRGRIAKEIRNALDNWPTWQENGVEDNFFSELTQKYTYQTVYPALHNALLHLDEAAIFTIHGFCHRVLSQQAFSSGVDFNVQMEADTADIELESVRDWYRTLTQLPEQYLLLTVRWKTPDDFFSAFRRVFSSTTLVESINASTIKEQFQQQKNESVQQLKKNEDFIFSELISNHKAKEVRTEEWETLISWLESTAIEAMPKKATQVFNGGRFPKKDLDKKERLKEVFSLVVNVKKLSQSIKADIQQAYSYQVAKQGIDIIRLKVSSAKKQARVMNYDDLIQQLAKRLLAGSLNSERSLSELIREQYPVALVDEFQDTDPLQYDILKTIYHHKKDLKTALFMIGDPKQAIYAFRSGDVFTYLSAKDDADYLWQMNTNWRSSTQMIKAYNRLFYGAPLNEPVNEVFGFGIEYRPVKAAAQADKNPLSSAIMKDTGALQLIHFPFNEDFAQKRTKKETINQNFCPVIAAWCSAEIHALLTTNTKIGDAPLQEQDIAILVRDKREAAYMQDALRDAGYPSVYLSTHDNVFLSHEAGELEQALTGILLLENDRAMVAALSTRFMGCDTQALLALQEDESLWDSHRERMLDLRETWFKRGFMAMALKLLHQNFTPDPKHHERALTNAIQLLELLQQASQRHHQPEQLLKWFREQIEGQGSGTESELRLESDANLIRIITQHGCKGLEYPVVFIPFSTRYKEPAKFNKKSIDLYQYHEPKTKKLTVFIGQDKEIQRQYVEEAWAETIRLLYVAITRAEHRCYLCATPFSNYHLSPLGRTLMLSERDDLSEALQSLASDESKAIHFQSITETAFPVTHSTRDESNDLLSVSKFTGIIERHWWLSSFSALTRNLRQGGVSTPDRDVVSELGISDADVIVTVDNIRFSLKKGAATGNLLHDILEHTDFSQPQWERSIQRPLMRFTDVLDDEQQASFIVWLDDCLDAPLSKNQNIANETEQNILDNDATCPRLNQLTREDTLREIEFYFPMENVSLGALGYILSQYRTLQNVKYSGSQTDKVSLVQLPGYQTLQGMMHGFIDLIFQYQGKYYLADYKSSFLGASYDAYNNQSMRKNIRENYYDLQYLLYSLALHRYLKQRIPDYHPDEHFGGAYYLYLRGMNRDSAHGVYYAAIDSKTLMSLDDLFSGKNLEGENFSDGNAKNPKAYTNV